jgi:hypothetical protein
MRVNIFIIVTIMVSWSIALSQEVDAGKPPRSFTEKFQPRFGALAGLMVPVGDVSSVMKTGFGGRGFGDIVIPVGFLNNAGLVFRAGLQFGYTSLSSEGTGFDAKVGMFPIVAYTEIGYPLRFGLTPALHLGLGGTSASLKDQSGGGNDTSSFDATLQIGAAFGYRAFDQVEILLHTGYAVLFEEINGSFVWLSLGAAYRL